MSTVINGIERITPANGTAIIGKVEIDQVTSGANNVGRAATVVSPAAQASTDAWTDVAGSTLDTLNRLAVSYTCVNSGADTISWRVLGANASDFSDAVEVQASADILTTAAASYSTDTAVWRYYKIQIESKVAGTPGAATVNGVAKG
jgi:hypothetical protein